MRIETYSFVQIKGVEETKIGANMRKMVHAKAHLSP